MCDLKPFGMKIIIDSAIPYLDGILEPFFDVVYKSGSEITRNDVMQCDAMFVRTRTVCNKELLDGSKVKFIGTATIGTDHIDLDYCTKAGIEVCNAAGCNAMAVVQWVLSSIREQDKTEPIIPSKTTIGVVGVGNVGGRLVDVLDKMGFIVLKNDPIRERNEPSFYSTPIEDILKKSDFVTFHTPLTTTGNHPTKYLLNSKNIVYTKPNATIINASRGGVIEELAVLNALKTNKLNNLFIDVWENEPNINVELLSKAKVTTPHIAGYSKQGKANGTAIIVDYISHFFNIPKLKNWYPSQVNQPTELNDINWANIKRIIGLYYDINKDSIALKSDISNFENLRNNYSYRDEFM